MLAELQDVNYGSQGLSAAVPDAAACSGPAGSALPAQALATAVPPGRLGPTPIPLHSAAGTVPVAAAEQHPQEEGCPCSSTKQLATGHASELTACSGTPITEAEAAVHGPSVMGLAAAAAAAAGGSACEQEEGPGGAANSALEGTCLPATVASSALEGTGLAVTVASSALEGRGVAAMAASSAPEGASTAATAAGKAAEPAGRAAAAAGRSRQPTAPATRKRKAAKAGRTGAALTGPQKRARLRGEAAVAMRRLEQARQQQQHEDAAGAASFLPLETLSLQEQRRLQWQAMRAHAGQTLHGRSKREHPARVLPQQARPSAQPLRKRYNRGAKARPVPPDRQGLPSRPQRAEGAVADGERDMQGAMAGGPPGPGGLVAGDTAPQLWGAAHMGATHAGAVQPPEQAAPPGRAAVLSAAPCAPWQPGTMCAGGMQPPRLCMHQHSQGPTIKCSAAANLSQTAQLTRVKRHSTSTRDPLQCSLLQAACCMLGLMLMSDVCQGSQLCTSAGRNMRHAVLTKEHTLCMSATGLPRHQSPAASNMTNSWLCKLLPQGPSHCQDHHQRHHLCHQAGRGSTGWAELQCSMTWSGRPRVGCAHRRHSMAAHCQEHHCCQLCHQPGTGSAALPKLHFSTGCSMTWSGWPPARWPHRCHSLPAHLLGLCRTWALLGRAAAPRLRWAPPASGTKAMVAGCWQQSTEPSLLLGAQEQTCSHLCRLPHCHHPWISLAAGCRPQLCLELHTCPQPVEILPAACSQQVGWCHSQRRAQGLCHLPRPAGQALQVKRARLQDGGRRHLH